MEILKTSADRIVLDLRSNPGGYLERAQDVAGWFLEKSQVVVIEDFSEKEEQIVYKAKGGSEFLTYPIVILINEGTASASEILASALRDNRGIKLIGKTSYGKGSVQTLIDLKEHYALKLTTAKSCMRGAPSSEAPALSAETPGSTSTTGPGRSPGRLRLCNHHQRAVP